MTSDIKIIYVDDELDMLDLAKTFLEHRCGFQVSIVENAEKALEMLRQGMYDVIVSDLIMPGTDGISLLKEIRASGCNVPFIVFTAKGREEFITAAYDAGADFHVQKDSEPNVAFTELAMKVRHLHNVRVRNEQLESLNMAVDSTSEGIAIINGDLTHLYVNPSYANMFGKGISDDIIGSIVPDAIRPYLDAVIKYVEESGRCEGRIRLDPGGASIHISVSSLDHGGAVIICRDITEENESRKVLDALNARNAALLEAIPDKMFIIDGEGNFLDFHVNADGMDELLTLDIIGRNVSDILDAEVSRQVMEGISMIRCRGGSFQFSFSLKTKKGSRHLDSGMVSCGKERYLIIERDVTELFDTRSELVRNERSLEESRRMMDSLLRTKKEMICRFLPDSTLTFVNDAYCRQFDRSPRELLGTKFLELVPEIWHEPLRQKISSLTPEEPFFKYAHEIRRSDGSVGWHEWHDSGFFDEDGRLTFLQAVGTDITDMIEATEQMDRERHLQEILIEIQNDLILSGPLAANASIHRSLEHLGEFLGVDRVYVFEYDFRMGVCNNTHEWCTDGIEPQIRKLQMVPLDEIPLWTECHRNGGTVDIPDVSMHEEEGTRRILEDQGVKSLLSIPMMEHGRCLGFVGLDSVKKRRSYGMMEVHLLRIFADMLVSLYRRLDAETDLERGERIRRILIDDYPDIIYAIDMGGSVHHVSPNVTDVIGHTAPELKEGGVELITDPGTRPLHDVCRCSSIVSECRMEGIIEVCLKVRCRNGSKVWMQTSNRLWIDKGRRMFIGQARKVRDCYDDRTA